MWSSIRVWHKLEAWSVASAVLSPQTACTQARACWAIPISKDRGNGDWRPCAAAAGRRLWMLAARARNGRGPLNGGSRGAMRVRTLQGTKASSSGAGCLRRQNREADDYVDQEVSFGNHQPADEPAVAVEPSRRTARLSRFYSSSLGFVMNFRKLCPSGVVLEDTMPSPVIVTWREPPPIRRAMLRSASIRS
jgi:hypothetical protein